MAAVSLSGCAPATTATPVVTAIVDTPRPPPGSDPLTPEERLLALLTADNPGIERVAMSLARLGDEMTRREAGRRLVSLARAVTSPRWRAEGLAEGASKAALERARTRALAPLFAAMSHVDGSAVVALAFALAEDEAAPRERRVLALRVLGRTIPAEDRAGVERRARIEARLPQPVQGVRPGDVARFIQPAANACFRRALSEDPGFAGATVRLTLRFATDGSVTGAAEGTAPEGLRRCLVAAIESFQATEGVELAPVVQMPITFTKQ